MKYFIDPNDNTLHAYEEDGSQDKIIPKHFVVATQGQIDAIVNPPVSPNMTIIAQIVQLEITITPRRLREATLTDAGKSWLESVDTHIAALRAQLV